MKIAPPFFFGNGMNKCEKNSRRKFIFSPAVLFIFVLLEFAITGFSEKFRAFPFLISLFVLGMPHGAADFSRIRETFGATRVWTQFFFYLLIIGSTVALLFLFPLASLGAFALISMRHFGRGDYERLKQPSARVLSICRGIFVVGIPLVASPEAVFAICHSWLGLLAYGEGTLRDLEQNWPSILDFFYLATATAGLVWLGNVIFLATNGDEKFAFAEVVETAVMAAAFSLLDPLFAVGLWFVCWHSFRQVAAEFPPAKSPWGRLESATGLGLRSLPLMIPTIVLYALLGWFAIGEWDPVLWASLLLLFFAAVTPAHEWLDLRIQSIQ